MEHKRDATVAGLGWPSNPNRGSASTESAPESGGQASELCHPVAPAPTTSTTSAPLKANTTPNDLGTTSLNDTYSAPALPDVPFLPYRAKSYLQFLPAPSLLITSGPPDPLQDHYALQQYQGVIHWRNSHLGALQMSWSWTLLLRSFWQLGVVPTHCGLLAPPLWDSSSTWAPSFSQCSHWDDFSCRGTPPNYQDPGVSQTTFRHLDGSYGIWRNQRHMENCWRHELPRRDPNTSTRSELPFWVKWPQLCTLASCRFICFDWLCQPRPRRSSKIKPRYMRGVCVCVTSEQM